MEYIQKEKYVNIRMSECHNNIIYYSLNKKTFIKFIVCIYLFTSYNSNLKRITNEEKKSLDKMLFEDYNNIRRAAEVHRQVSNKSSERILYLKELFLINHLFIIDD